MSKKIFLAVVSILLLIGLAVAGWLGWRWWVSQSSTTATTTDQLSDRAKEFMKTQSGGGTGLWSEVTVVDPAATATTKTTSTLVSTDCFDLRTSDAIDLDPNQDPPTDCTIRAKVRSPSGRLVLSAKRIANPLTEGGIIMRQKNPQDYKLETFAHPLFSKTWLYRSSDAVTLFGWHNGTLIICSLAQLSQPERVTTEIVTNIINQLSLK